MVRRSVSGKVMASAQMNKAVPQKLTPQKPPSVAARTQKRTNQRRTRTGTVKGTWRDTRPQIKPWALIGQRTVWTQSLICGHCWRRGRRRRPRWIKSSRSLVGNLLWRPLLLSGPAEGFSRPSMGPSRLQQFVAPHCSVSGLWTPKTPGRWDWTCSSWCSGPGTHSPSATESKAKETLSKLWVYLTKRFIQTLIALLIIIIKDLLVTWCSLLCISTDKQCLQLQISPSRIPYWPAVVDVSDSSRLGGERI